MKGDCEIVRCIEEEFYLFDTRELMKFEEHQRRILNHVFTLDKDGKLPYRTIVISCPKKSGKTAVAAAVTHATLRKFGGNCYSLANDMDAARSRMFDRVAGSLRIMAEKNPSLYEEVLEPKCYERIWVGNQITYQDHGQLNVGHPHWLQYVAQDYAGEAGGMPALTVWDELWGYRSQGSERLWDEMVPIPNLPISFRLVTTYAGWHGESALLWSIYNDVVAPNPYTEEPEGERIPGLEDLPCFRKGAYFVYWDHVARMKWHTQEFMDEMRADPALEGRESEYQRIWENRWTTGLDSYLPIEKIDILMKQGSEIGLRNHFDDFKLDDELVSS